MFIRMMRWTFDPMSRSLQFSSSREGRKCLCNDARNTFCLQSYGVGHIVKDHSGRKYNIWYSFRLAERGLLYAPYSEWIIHRTAFGAPIVEHWLEREITQWVRHQGSIPLPFAP